jgi:hypothetical protein
MTGRRTVAALVMLAWPSPALAVASEACQAAWERAERARVELGLRPGPKTAPEDLLEAACDALLATPEEDLRDAIRLGIEICGGDCRDLRKLKTGRDR